MKTRLTALAALSIALSACSLSPSTDTAFKNEHNARIALDWAGTYKGTLPCADCEGIATVVTLAENGIYQMRSEYLGRRGPPLETEGTFTWNTAGNTITLKQKEPVQYFVTENRLIQRAMDGSTITGPLANAYVLTKVTKPQ